MRTGASTANPLNPLEMFISDADRDPGLLPARQEDANRDGVVFHVAPDGRPTIRLPYAFQAVELLFEASDRQSDSVAFGQVVQSVGYWVESRAGGDDVASAARPYRLMRFDDAWSRSCADCDLLFEDIWVNLPAYIVARSPQPWRTLATYRLTHAAGFDGLGSGVSPLQAWHTDARAGAGAPNGTGALEAREIQEARFPDGRHLVHALAGDIRAETDTVFEVVVDNFRPYVKAVRLLTEGGRELYRSAWTFDPDTSQLVLQRSDAVSALHAGDRLRLEVEFSEPMEGVKLLAITPALGPVPALTSTQAFDARTTWSGTLPVSVLPRRDGLAHLYISGQDLAGTTLYPFPSDAPITAPFNKRSDATPIVDPTVDSVHGIPLSHVPVERTPRSKLGD